MEDNKVLDDLERIKDILNGVRYSPALGKNLTRYLQRVNKEELIPYVQYDTKKGQVIDIENAM